MTEQEAYLVGYWFGDGSGSLHHSNQFIEVVLNGTDDDWDRVKKALLEADFNARAYQTTKTTWRVAPGPKFKELLTKLGVELTAGSKQKKLTKELLGLDAKLRRMLIAGLIDSDGNVRLRKTSLGSWAGNIRYGTRSGQLARDVAFLFSQEGWRSAIYETPTRTSLAYEVELRKAHYHDFESKIPLQEKKQTVLGRLCNTLVEKTNPVGVRKRGLGFLAQVARDGKTFYLGCYRNALDAEEAVRQRKRLPDLVLSRKENYARRKEVLG